ncbi:hypothetical protein ACLVWU_03230 [Bdellovibrio sp. HCB290]|uniref:hypothetical protein n=1 Tax=Bdellovibrio sp. HCB290 TaxID=3394356 RepID=UPI0039B57F0E
MSHAAPSAKTSLDTQPLTGEDDPYLSDKAAALRTPAPTWQLGVFGGFGGGHVVENDEWPQGLTYGLRIATLERERPAWDLHIEFGEDNNIGIFGAHRWNLENDRFYPYARLAVGTFLDPDDELGNIVQIKRFRVRGGVGVGETFFFEMGAGLAVVGVDLYAITGYGFNF